MDPPFPPTWSSFPPDPPARIRGQNYTHGHPQDDRRHLDHTSSATLPRSDRQRHLQYLHSLLHVLTQRHPTLIDHESKQKNATRIGRIVRILWSCREWREGDLWKEGLAWAGLDDGTILDEQQDQAPPIDGTADLNQPTSTSLDAPPSPTSSAASSSPASLSDQEQATDSSPEEFARLKATTLQSTERRLAFLRSVASRRRGLRPLMLANRAQELMSLGRWNEALEEIELVIQSPAYRSFPELNLYAGLLVVLVASTRES